ncbi:hypothetical protein GC194_00765 [bacterium]|nr:hypothetical protein [bacterium]
MENYYYENNPDEADNLIDKTESNKTMLWLAAFIMGLLFFAIGFYYSHQKVTPILMGSIFAFIGLLFGYKISALLSLTSLKRQYAALTGLLICGIAAVVGARQVYAKDLLTCQICGYQSINSYHAEDGCPICLNPLWSSGELNEYYSSETQWMAREQRFWFGDNFPNDTVDFYFPVQIMGYAKDSLWKPLDTSLIDSMVLALQVVNNKKVDVEKIFFENSMVDSANLVEEVERLKGDYTTCEVCGYLAVEKENEISGCQVCHNPVWNGYAERIWRNISKQEWLVQEQKSYFGHNFPSDSVDFSQPLTVDGYVKNPVWKPIDITKPYKPVFYND